MKKSYIMILSIVISAVFFTGCSKASLQTDFKTYKQEPKIEENTAIVLFGVKGRKIVDYLQFGGTSKALPAYNYRNLTLSENIIALKVPIPENDFRFGVYASGRAGYTPLGYSYGYISVYSKKLRVNKKGIYFFGVLDTNHDKIDHRLDEEYINLAKRKYPKLFRKLKPINFD